MVLVGTDGTPSNGIRKGRRGAKHQEAIHMDHRDQMPQLLQCFVFKAIAGANGAVETLEDWAIVKQCTDTDANTDTDTHTDT